MSNDLIVEKNNQTLKLTMNRPERRNALSDDMLNKMLEELLEHLNQGNTLNKINLNEYNVQELNLLTDKPVLFICNVDEQSLMNENKNAFVDIILPNYNKDKFLNKIIKQTK